MWVRARAASSKGTVSPVPTRFRPDSGKNLFKKGEIVAGQSCGSAAQLARVLARYARGPGFESRSGHVLFSSPMIDVAPDKELFCLFFESASDS